MSSFLLANSTWKTIKDQHIDLVILPWGATEAHNYHLPYGTDNIETERFAAASAKLAQNLGAQIIVLPTIPFGVNTGQFDIKLDINLNPSTQFAILDDIIASLDRQGIHKFLILNGHGGNDFKQILRELGLKYPKMFLSTCNWFQSVKKSNIFENNGDHADEMETSLMQFLSPELVLPISEAGTGKAKKLKIKSLNENWAWTERKWSKVTDDTGIGDPSKSNAEKGERYFNAVCEKIAKLMLEIANADLNDLYE
jgi:creatinine amidohydrolase